MTRRSPLNWSAAVLLGTTLCTTAQTSALPVERATLFATCAGRFAALTRHYADTDNPDLAETRSMTVQFEDLLDATLPDALPHGLSKTDAEAIRTAGLQDVSELILAIRLGITIERAGNANQTFVEKLQICASLLLPPTE